MRCNLLNVERLLTVMSAFALAVCGGIFLPSALSMPAVAQSVTSEKTIDRPGLPDGEDRACANVPISITLRADDVVQIDDNVTRREKLIEELVKRADSQSECRILLRPGEGAAAGEFVAVMGDVRNAGFNNLAIVTDPKAQR